MAVFAYKSASFDGKLTRGTIEAADEDAAINALKSSGDILLEIRPGRRDAGRSFLRKKNYDLLTFTTEMSSLLNAGLPLDKALGILSEISENRDMRQTVGSVLTSVKEGNSFSEALHMHPDVFPGLYINMIRAGEAGGVLDTVLENLNQFLEARKELKEQVTSAIIYPVILVATSGLSIIFLLTYVLPKFNAIFQDMGGALPLSTKALLTFSGYLRGYWWALMGLAFFVWLLFRGYSAGKEGRYRVDGLKVRLLGGIVTKVETARFCRTLGTLLTSGVPLLTALNNSKEVMTNQVMADAIEAAALEVSEGKGIAQSISKTGVFPQLAISMIQVGEETGQLAEMLMRVASIYEKFLKNAIRKLIGFLEPALILCMGIITGFIVVSMLSAIFSITDIQF